MIFTDTVRSLVILLLYYDIYRYRKISGDTCHGGLEYRYDPYMLSCPVAGN